MVQSPSGNSPDDFIGFTIVRLAHVLQQRMDSSLHREVGISVRQFGALSYLDGNPGIGSAALARRLLITAQSAGPLVDDLERRGLLSRETSFQAGKLRAIELTPAGRKTLELAYKVAERLRAEDEANLTAAEAEFVNKRLQEMLTRLTASSDG